MSNTRNTPPHAKHLHPVQPAPKAPSSPLHPHSHLHSALKAPPTPLHSHSHLHSAATPPPPPDLRANRPLAVALSRARLYVAKIPPAISGQGGHNRTFSVAIALVHGFALNEPDAWPILQAYNTRCVPPWSERELQHKLTSAARITRHSQPRGYLLASERSHFHQPARNDRKTHPTQPHLGKTKHRDQPATKTPGTLDPDTLDPTTFDPAAFNPTVLPPGTTPPPPSGPRRPSPQRSNPPPDRKRDVLPEPTKAGKRPGPTLQHPIPTEGFIDPRTNPTTEWLHIPGYMSIPPMNCPTCWLQRSRSLWIGSCLCAKR